MRAVTSTGSAAATGSATASVSVAYDAIAASAAACPWPPRGRGRGVYGARREVVGRGGARYRDIARNQRHERLQRGFEKRDFARAQGSDIWLLTTTLVETAPRQKPRLVAVVCT